MKKESGRLEDAVFSVSVIAAIISGIVAIVALFPIGLWLIGDDIGGEERIVVVIFGIAASICLYAIGVIRIFFEHVPVPKKS